jgi:hypothetical protein
MKKMESEVVEFLYEYIVKRAIPVFTMPATFRSYISKIFSNHKIRISTVLAFDRDKFEEILNTLIVFEKNTMPIGTYKFTYSDTNILDNLDNADGKPIDKLCHNYPRLYELYNFLQIIKTDFIITLNIDVHKTTETQPYEFSIGIDGLTLMNGSNRMCEYDVRQSMIMWSDICTINGWGDFSELIDTDNNNLVIYHMLYTPPSMTELDS